MVQFNCSSVPSEIRDKLPEGSCIHSRTSIDSNSVDQACSEFMEDAEFPNPKDSSVYRNYEWAYGSNSRYVAKWENRVGVLKQPEIDALSFCAANGNDVDVYEPPRDYIFALANMKGKASFEVGVGAIANIMSESCVYNAKQVCTEAGLGELMEHWESDKYSPKRAAITNGFHQVLSTVGRRGDSVPALKYLNHKILFQLLNGAIYEDSFYAEDVRKKIDCKAANLIINDVYGPVVEEGDVISFNSLAWWYDRNKEKIPDIAAGISRLFSNMNLTDLVGQFDEAMKYSPEDGDSQYRIQPKEPLLAMFTVALYADDDEAAQGAKAALSDICMDGGMGVYPNWSDEYDEFCELPLSEGSWSAGYSSDFNEASRRLGVLR